MNDGEKQLLRGLLLFAVIEGQSRAYTEMMSRAAMSDELLALVEQAESLLGVTTEEEFLKWVNENDA